MNTSITALATQLQDITQWQRTPHVLMLEEYEQMIVKAIKRLLIDTGRASSYTDNLLKVVVTNVSGGESGETTSREAFFGMEFLIDEEAYILICAQLEFFKRVQNDVNNIVGYTTDALTVTNADKPYANLKDTIANLEQERRITYYKMIRYAL